MTDITNALDEAIEAYERQQALYDLIMEALDVNEDDTSLKIRVARTGEEKLYTISKVKAELKNAVDKLRAVKELAPQRVDNISWFRDILEEYLKDHIHSSWHGDIESVISATMILQEIMGNK